MADLSPLGKAVLAGFVADAATMPLHWHYDIEEIKSILVKADRLKNPQFLSPLETKFYSAKEFPGHYDLGQLSCYSEQSVMTLEYFQANDGKFLGGESFAQFMFDWFKKYSGRLDTPTKAFLKNAEDLKKDNKSLYPDAGADDKQTMHTFKIPVIALALVSGEEETYFKAIEEASRAHQNKDMVSEYARAYGILIRNLLQGDSLSSIVESMINDTIKVSADVKSALEYVFMRKAKPSLDAQGWDDALVTFSTELTGWLFAKYGGADYMQKIASLTCSFPGCFMVALKIVLDTLEEFPNVDQLKAEGFAFATRRNILYGGDNCGRTFIIGPLLVLCGVDIPDDLLNQLKKEEHEKLVTLIKAVSK